MTAVCPFLLNLETLKPRPIEGQWSVSLSRAGGRRKLTDKETRWLARWGRTRPTQSRGHPASTTQPTSWLAA